MYLHNVIVRNVLLIFEYNRSRVFVKNWPYLVFENNSLTYFCLLPSIHIYTRKYLQQLTRRGNEIPRLSDLLKICRHVGICSVLILLLLLLRIALYLIILSCGEGWNFGWKYVVSERQHCVSCALRSKTLLIYEIPSFAVKTHVILK